MIRLEGVSKQFGSHEVIKSLNLTVPSQCVFGFLGQNGAGKTTTMKMILGLLNPSEGRIFVCDEEVVYGETKTNRFIGYLPDVPEYYSYMTPREYLKLCGEMTGMSKAQIKAKSDELLTLVGLADVNRKIGGFSRGMKQRLGIAQALLNEPKILICDEPTSALDPIGRKEILDILHQVKEKTTVIFSTHILSDVERICDQVAVLHEGEIVLSGTLTDVKNQHRQDAIRLTFESEKVAKHLMQDFERFKKVELEGNELTIYVDNLKQDSQEILKWMTDQNILLLKYGILEPTLESLFMEVVR